MLDGVHLVVAYLDAGHTPAQCLVSERHIRHPEVAAVLRCDERIPAGYKLFVHLKGPGGAFANGDHDFLSGYLSPQKLKPGSYLRDVTRLQVPAHFPPSGGRRQVMITGVGRSASSRLRLTFPWM